MGSNRVLRTAGCSGGMEGTQIFPRKMAVNLCFTKSQETSGWLHPWSPLWAGLRCGSVWDEKHEGPMSLP